MQKHLDQLKNWALTQIDSISSIDDLRELEVSIFGRKGKLTAVLRNLGNVPSEERKEMGQKANMVKQSILSAIESHKNKLQKSYYAELGKNERIDVSLPGQKPKTGHTHPISQFIAEVEDVFGRMGFVIADGPEIETEYFNFDALNMPETHSARDMQDTFWMDMKDRYVLRTQTSNMQIRYMQNHKPPIRLIAPGKTYRKDSDATHSPMFHQFEGLMVDKNISIGHLRAVLLEALQKLLHPLIKLRLRISYFPFVEPGLEADVSCVMCMGVGKNDEGKKCHICKGTGWLEMCGAGMVHPEVLKNGGIDPNEYTGFAFGFGIERLTMIKHKIDNIRLFYDNDIRFLEQF